MNEEKWTTLICKKSVSEKLNLIAAKESIKIGKKVSKKDMLEKIILEQAERENKDK